MVVGVNGVGKTTTIGKLAYNFKKAGKSVLLGARRYFPRRRRRPTDHLERKGGRAHRKTANGLGSRRRSVRYRAERMPHAMWT